MSLFFDSFAKQLPYSKGNLYYVRFLPALFHISEKAIYIFWVSAIFWQRNYLAWLVGNSLELNKHSSERDPMYYSEMAEQGGQGGMPLQILVDQLTLL